MLVYIIYWVELLFFFLRKRCSVNGTFRDCQQFRRSADDHKPPNRYRVVLILEGYTTHALRIDIVSPRRGNALPLPLGAEQQSTSFCVSVAFVRHDADEASSAGRCLRFQWRDSD
jgi:hypothetical protein